MLEDGFRMLRKDARCGTIEQVKETSSMVETIPDFILDMSTEEKAELLEMWMRSKQQQK